MWGIYLSLQSSDKQAVEDLAGFVAVADVLEGLRCVLTANIEQDLLTSTIHMYQHNPYLNIIP